MGEVGLEVKKPKLRLDGHKLKALVEAVKAAEEIKPAQQAKRIVFAKYGIIGTGFDQVLTAIFYDIMKRLGVIDKAIRDITGVHPCILDPWLRAALRVAIAMLKFYRLSNSTRQRLQRSVAALLSSNTHPYVGMYYFRLIPEIEKYQFRPASIEEEFELKYLLPAWLIRRLRELLGPQEAEELLKALNTKLPLSVRVNTLKATVEEVVRELKKEGKRPVVSERVPVVVKFEGPYNFDKSRLYKEGKIIVQEESSAAASPILGPRPGETVVDMCAAPGGKTTHMAELMKNQGVVYAFDIDSYRLKRMRMLLKRMGITIVKIYNEDATKAPRILGEEMADRVLVDAPCSATGTLMKNPDLRWRVREDELPDIIDLQRRLLEAAVRLLKPGGRLLYCTCSLLPEENEWNIQWLLHNHPELRLVEIKGPYDSSPWLPGTMRAWPHRHNTTGFFYALIEKVEKR